MKIHDLKCWPTPFKDMKGSKFCEFRKNDRDYQTGDLLLLREYEPAFEGFTRADPLLFKVTHVQTGFGIPDGYVMMSVLRVYL